GALRPHLNVPAKPDHGLYAFFRKREVDGKVIYDTVEDGAGMQDVFGRAWTAAELRRKSFKDLHTLWYVLLRERNLLATQVENYRRASIAPGMVARTIGTREHQCRKSMARIKYVINERRLAYEGALKILADKKAEAEKEAEPSQIAEGDASEPKAEKAA
ncbi:mitochondrial 39-S ribosomal protein L47 (MRP-L47)-domain-containing protein, partial [Gloeopeniophorella convolvens]